MDTYKATNTINGKFYIGSAINFEKRKKEHSRSTENYPFQNALRADPDAFVWEVWSDNSEDRELEQALLDMWFGKEQCYNLNPKASAPPVLIGELNPRFGLTVEENPHYGKQWWVNKIEEKERFTLEHPGTGWELGRLKVSLETKQKQSEKGRGKKIWVNPEGKTTRSHKQPGADWVLGTSETTRSKQSDNNKGEKNPSFGKRWWVNVNGDKKYQPVSPGPEWQNGRVYRPGV